MSEDHFLNLQPGTIVNGRYEIVKCLGTGSMGMVYACRHRELSGHLVAMKVLFSEVARDSVAAARFRNEIVASYGVSHPNVVRAYEYFRDGDLIAFTMEYIGGGDLADRINSADPLLIDESVRMLCQMCSGVQAIHDAGIVHRDLKPENILLTPQGDIKITDFGIARMGGGPKLTEHGGVVGTIDYVSPEYLEKSHVDARSDIYALGVLAYEMITGESPFRGDSLIEKMTKRLREDPHPPDELRPDCPSELSKIILKALTRDPERRYQTGIEMLHDLQSFNSNSLSFSTNSKSVSDENSDKHLRPMLQEGKDKEGGQKKLERDTSHRNHPIGNMQASSPVTGQHDAQRSPSPTAKPLLVRTSNSPKIVGRHSMKDPWDRERYEKMFQSREAGYNDREDENLYGKDREDFGRRIPISQPHLSLERVQQLSGGFKAIQDKSNVRSFFLLMLILLIGFGVGLFALSVLKVWFFDENNEPSVLVPFDR